MWFKNKFEINSEVDMQIQYHRVGPSENPVVIIDNVFKEPDYIRFLALNNI